MRTSSAVGAAGAMLAAARAVPSAGQNPASLGKTRWHVGQLFMKTQARYLSPPLAYRERGLEQKPRELHRNEL